ncbi:MAG: molecular chaperone HtpG [Alphaproteobacteria bacterium]|nr:molecular chaperone HtpG [Alphaproteobacteria bacterium]
MTEHPSSSPSETHQFGTETDRLLHLVTHSLYSDRSIFLRELISNAADACDRRRIQSLRDDSNESASEVPAPSVCITLDPDNKVLQIKDNGIGMNRAALIDALGTIARSGTRQFMESLTSSSDAAAPDAAPHADGTGDGDAGDDGDDDSATTSAANPRGGEGLIGQFGVGFYSVFMVADHATVRSRQAGEDEGWLWQSDGKAAYSVESAAIDEVGTQVTLHLKEDADEFLQSYRVESIVKSWSNHLAIPISLLDLSSDARDGEDDDEDGEEPDGGTKPDSEVMSVPRQINAADAIWRRSKSEITDADYQSFFADTLSGRGNYSSVLHFQVEGMQSWFALFYIPETPPHDLFYADRQGSVRLYVRRNFVTDNSDELMPRWLRFLRGVVDSDDFPLAISREMLKNDPLLGRIRRSLTTRILRHLKELATQDVDAYLAFWDNYGAVLKEGLYDFMDTTNRDDLLGLTRYWSMTQGRMVSLAEYAEEAGDKHNYVFTLTGEKKLQLLESPHLEGFRANGVDVLISTDAIDDFWMPMVGQYQDRRFITASNAGKELEEITANAKAAKASDSEDDKNTANSTSKESSTTPSSIDVLLKAAIAHYGDRVESVRTASHLVSSPMCLASAQDGMTIQMERLLAAQGMGGMGMGDKPQKYVLELNPQHLFVQGLNDLANAGDARLATALDVMLDTSYLIEGLAVDSPKQLGDSIFHLLSGAFSADNLAGPDSADKAGNAGDAEDASATSSS